MERFKTLFEGKVHFTVEPNGELWKHGKIASKRLATKPVGHAVVEKRPEGDYVINHAKQVFMSVVQAKKFVEKNKLADTHEIHPVKKLAIAAGNLKEEKSHIENHPMEKMREYTHSEFPWEYREYTQYGKSRFPHAFKDEHDFAAKYKAAPMKHLEPHEIHSLEYSTAAGYLHNGSVASKQASARNEFSHRRDVDRIHNDLHHGKTAPPIVLKHSKGMRILGGNTRLSYGLASNKNVPVKVIDISDKH